MCGHIQLDAGSGDPNSGLHVFVASALPMSQRPLPRTFLCWYFLLTGTCFLRMPSAYSSTVLLTYGLLWLLCMGEEFNPGLTTGMPS